MTTITPANPLLSLLNPTTTSATTPANSGTANAASEVNSLLGGSSGDGSSSSSISNVLDSLVGSTSSGDGLSSTDGLPQLPSSLISLLQAYQPGNASSQEVGLLGGDGDSLTGGIENTILSSSYANDLSEAYSLASANGATDSGTSSGSGTGGTTTTDPVQAAISSYNSAINAYNTTLLNQAQTVLADNSSLTA